MRHFLLISVLFICISCNEKGVTYESSESAELMHLALDDGAWAGSSAPLTKQSPQPSTVGEEIIKKIIKTGGIDFQSEDLEKDYQKIRALLPQFKAYIENENQSKSAQRIRYDVTIRVPADIYDTLYTSISSIAFKIDRRYSNVEDVTERYYDLKTRLKNKEALEKRYLELLKQASNMQDILEIEKNLNEVRTEIERLQGQFNYLSKQINLSTISLSFYEILPYQYDSTNRKGFGARLLSALDDGWQGFLAFLVGFTTFWPFLISLIGTIYLFRKLKKKWKRKNN